MTPLRFEPATFRLVARCVNQLRYHVQAPEYRTGNLVCTFSVPLSYARVYFQLIAELILMLRHVSTADCSQPEGSTRAEDTCINSPTRRIFSYVFILKFSLCMFRTDTPFIIRSLRITVYAAVCTHHAQHDMYKQLLDYLYNCLRCAVCKIPRTEDMYSVL